MNRLPIAISALCLGYCIRSIVGGGYFLIPGALVLASLLVWLVLRSTAPATIAMPRILDDTVRATDDGLAWPARRHSTVRDEEGPMKTALDVAGPLTRDESDLLVMLYDGGRRLLLDSKYSHLKSALADRSRGGLIYLNAGYWDLTVFGHDVAVEIKAADAAHRTDRSKT